MSVKRFVERPSVDTSQPRNLPSNPFHSQGVVLHHQLVSLPFASAQNARANIVERRSSHRGPGWEESSVRRLVHTVGTGQQVAEDNSSCSRPLTASAWCAYELDALSMLATVDTDRRSPFLNSCVVIDESGSGNTLRLGQHSKESETRSGNLVVWVEVLSCGHEGPSGCS